MRCGDRVRVFATGEVTSEQSTIDQTVRIRLDSWGGATDWFPRECLEPIEPAEIPPPTPIEEWRTVAADAIRTGKDRDVIMMIGENSPTHAEAMLSDIASTREYLFALEAFYDALDGQVPHPDAPTRARWDRVQELRAKRFRPESTPEGYDALTKMERARTAMREAAWRYIDAGRNTTIGLELDLAALEYSQARAVYEVINKPPNEPLEPLDAFTSFDVDP